MRYNKINLFLGAVLVMILYFIVPANNDWLYSKILGVSVLEEMKHPDEMYRKVYRYGMSYRFYDQLQQKVKDTSVVILLPPQAYLKEKHVANFAVPEPAVFYYFTGVKSVWINSPNAWQATHALAVSGHSLQLPKIKNKEGRDSLISYWKHYMPTP
jgi:hypothetical protein